MKLDIKFIAKSAIIAALYVALTWLLAPISYGPIQFRISEVLVLLVIFNPKYAFALIIGCFISNTTSSIGWYDMVFGTAATAIAVIPMAFIKKLHISAIFPVIANAFIVSIELGLAFDMFQPEAFWYNVLTVGLGEAVVLYLLGIPVMITLYKNDMTKELIEMNDNVSIAKYSFVNTRTTLSTIIVVLGIILFIAYPLANNISNDYTKSAFNLLFNLGEIYCIAFAIIPILLFITSIFLKNKLLLIINTILAISLLIPLIIVGVRIDGSLNYPYYYIYITYIAIIIIITLLINKYNHKEKIEETNTNIEEI